MPGLSGKSIWVQSDPSLFIPGQVVQPETLSTPARFRFANSLCHRLARSQHQAEGC